MSTVASTNASMASLMQIFSNFGSPQVSSTLGSAAVQKALKNASPTDIVQISKAALQLQQSNAIFGVSDKSSTDPIAALISSAMGATSESASTAASATSSVAEQFAAAQMALQAQQTAALFGDSIGSSTGSLINVFG